MNPDSRPVGPPETLRTATPNGENSASGTRGAADREAPSRFPYRFLHQVFFRLADRTPDTFDQFSRHCWSYLSEHDGLLQFDLGFRDVEMQRPVNDLQFDISMSMLFDSVESYLKYRASDEHNEFITRAGSMSIARRVFDSFLVPKPTNHYPHRDQRAQSR